MEVFPFLIHVKKNFQQIFFQKTPLNMLKPLICFASTTKLKQQEISRSQNSFFNLNVSKKDFKTSILFFSTVVRLKTSYSCSICSLVFTTFHNNEIKLLEKLGQLWKSGQWSPYFLSALFQEKNWLFQGMKWNLMPIDFFSRISQASSWVFIYFIILLCF